MAMSLTPWISGDDSERDRRCPAEAPKEKADHARPHAVEMADYCPE